MKIIAKHILSWGCSKNTAKCLFITLPCTLQILHAVGMFQKLGSRFPDDVGMSSNVQKLRVNCDKDEKDKKEKISVSNSYRRWIMVSLRQSQTTKGLVRLGKPDPPLPKQNLYGSKPTFCIWWNQIDVVYYEQFQSRLIISGECYKQ